MHSRIYTFVIDEYYAIDDSFFFIARGCGCQNEQKKSAL